MMEIFKNTLKLTPKVLNSLRKRKSGKQPNTFSKGFKICIQEEFFIGISNVQISLKARTSINLEI
jgi:hypothetical protein